MKDKKDLKTFETDRPRWLEVLNLKKYVPRWSNSRSAVSALSWGMKNFIEDLCGGLKF